jgi:hypothetical protein
MITKKLKCFILEKGIKPNIVEFGCLALIAGFLSVNDNHRANTSLEIRTKRGRMLADFTLTNKFYHNHWNLIRLKTENVLKRTANEEETRNSEHSPIKGSDETNFH